MDDILFYGYPFLLLIMMALSALGGGPQCSLALTYVSFVALALALSAHIAWRRLHWVPVEGEVIEVRSGGPGSGSWSFGWRWSYGGVTHTATDIVGQSFLSLFNRIGRGTRATLWVDPRDPSRLLPPSWRDRLFLYLFFGGMSAYMALQLGALAL